MAPHCVECWPRAGQGSPRTLALAALLAATALPADAIVVSQLSGTLSSSEFEHALSYAALFLAAAGLILVVQAFVASRRPWRSLNATV